MIKKLIWSIIIFFIAIITCFIAFNQKRRVSLETNQTFIKNKVFGKDSEGRGYSDRAKEYMEDELKVFDNDAIMKVWFEKLLKQERKQVLVKSKNEYIYEFNKTFQIESCIVIYYNEKYSDRKFKRWNNSRIKFESENMSDLSRTVSYEYGKLLNKEELDSMFLDPKKSDCDRIRNEK